MIKKWLKKHLFPELPVLRWDQGAVFETIVQKDLRIEAVIANPKVIDSAQAHKPLSFCFEETKQAKKVSHWEDIAKALQ